MLPKEEKIKKKSSDVDQPGLFDKEDEKKRLAKKKICLHCHGFNRRSQTIFLGLSLC